MPSHNYNAEMSFAIQVTTVRAGDLLVAVDCGSHALVLDAKRLRSRRLKCPLLCS